MQTNDTFKELCLDLWYGTNFVAVMYGCDEELEWIKLCSVKFIIANT